MFPAVLINEHVFDTNLPVEFVSTMDGDFCLLGEVGMWRFHNLADSTDPSRFHSLSSRLPGMLDAGKV